MWVDLKSAVGRDLLWFESALLFDLFHPMPRCTFYLFISYCKLLFTSKKWCIFPSDSSPFPNHHPPITQKTHSFHVDLNILHQPRTLNLLFPAAQLLLAWIFFPRLRSSVGFWLGERLGVALDDEDQLGARLGGQGFPLNPMVRGIGLDWLRLPSPDVKVYIPQI